MRKIVYHIAISVDGFIADKSGAVDLFLAEGVHATDFFQSLARYDTVIMGKKTYEFGFQFGLQPGQPAYQGLKHLIVSQSLNFESNAEVQLIKKDAIDYLQQLKTTPGKDIWLCGGGNLAGHLATHKLIDEVIFKVNPLIMGEGIQAFEGLKQPLQLNLFHHKPYENGVVLQSYKISQN